MAEPAAVLYWDTSALLSFLFSDRYSTVTQKWAEEGKTHLLSSLAHAEACAVIARMTREQAIDAAQAATVRTAITSYPWRSLKGLPERDIVAGLAKKWPLRGADLWHLALAVSLQKDLPELRLLTFDARLREAATGEGIFPEGLNTLG